MRIKVIVGSFVALTFFVFASCSERDNPVMQQPPPSSQPPKVLVPLAVGNSWSYRVTTFDTTGLIVWADTLRFFIRSDTVVDGVRWALEGFEGVMGGQMGFRNDSTGYYESNLEGWYRLYPYPAQKGQVSGMFTVESVDSPFTTPLGELHCYVYRYDWFGHPGRMIFAPGIGTIHTDNVGRTWAGTVWLAQTMDLVAAEIDSATNQTKDFSPNTESFALTKPRLLLHITSPTTAIPLLIKNICGRSMAPLVARKNGWRHGQRLNEKRRMTLTR